MQNEISKRRVDKYNKKKLELERLKYELFGIVPKNERGNKRILKKKQQTQICYFLNLQ